VDVNVNVEDRASDENLKDLSALLYVCENALFHVCENKENQNKKRVILKAKRRNTIQRDIFLNIN